MTTFDTLGLGAQLLSSIEIAGFTEATSVQERAIPLLLEGRDLMATAQTGEGKTAAYLLPVLHRLAEQGDKAIPGRPRVLILAPTRELAAQIGDALRQFNKGQRLYYTVIYGGSPFLTQRQVLERGVHVLVATPGRLMDHIRRNTLSLDKVDTFILDEADRMLDMGFVDEVKEVATMLPAEHQTVMFSATMSRGVRGLASALLNKPELIEVGRENAVATNVDHRVMRVKYPDKNSLLLHLLARPDVSRVLVFTRTKAMADTLVREVQQAGLLADAIHGDLQQSVRQKVLRKFRAAQINILIATDVAARGIDVPDITHVINYDMPVEAEAYVHRVGRTGRAGAKGVALSICVANEGNLLRQIEQLIGIKVPVDADHPFHDDRAATRRDPRPIDGGKFKRSSQNSGPSRSSGPSRNYAGASQNRDRDGGARFSKRDDSQRDAPHRDAPPRDATHRDAPQRDAAPFRRPEAGAENARPAFVRKPDFAPRAEGAFKAKGPYKPHGKPAPYRDHEGASQHRDREGAPSHRDREAPARHRDRDSAPRPVTPRQEAPHRETPHRDAASFRRPEGDAAAPRPVRGDRPHRENAHREAPHREAPRRDATPFRRPESDAAAAPRPVRGDTPHRANPHRANPYQKDGAAKGQATHRAAHKPQAAHKPKNPRKPFAKDSHHRANGPASAKPSVHPAGKSAGLEPRRRRPASGAG